MYLFYYTVRGEKNQKKTMAVFSSIITRMNTAKPKQETNDNLFIPNK